MSHTKGAGTLRELFCTMSQYIFVIFSLSLSRLVVQNYFFFLKKLGFKFFFRGMGGGVRYWVLGECIFLRFHT